MGAGTSSQQPTKEATEVPRTSRSTKSSQFNAKPKAKVKGTARSTRQSRDGSRKKTRSHPASDDSDGDDNLHELERTLNSLDLGVLGNNLWEDGTYSANSIKAIRAAERDRRSHSDGGKSVREENQRDNRAYSDGVRSKKKIKMRTHKYSWEQRPQGKKVEPVHNEEDWEYKKPVIDGFDAEKFRNVNKKVPKPVANKEEEEEVIGPEKLIPDNGYSSLSYEKTPTYDFVEQKLLASIERETGFLD